MLSCYVTPTELLRFYSISRFAKEEQAIREKLAAATYTLGRDLRARGYDVSRLQTPLMFDDADDFTVVTKTADYTSEELEAVNETRFVVKADTDTQSTFTLEGSDDETIWRSIPDMTGADISLSTNGAGTYSALFIDRYKYLRYKLATSASITYTVYLIDPAVDSLIMDKAVELLLLPFIDKDTTIQSVYERACEAYRTGLQALVTDYETDDGVVTDVKNVVRLFR